MVHLFGTITKFTNKLGSSTAMHFVMDYYIKIDRPLKTCTRKEAAFFRPLLITDS